jgi:hypothetical protein
MDCMASFGSGPSAPADDFALLRRLCPKCDYILTGLPEPCRCPECGEPEQPGVRWIPLANRWYAWLLVIVMVASGAWMLIDAGMQIAAGGPWIDALRVLQGAMVAGFGIWYAVVIRRRAEHGVRRLRLDDRGVAILFAGTVRKSIAWTNVKELRVRRNGPRLWRVTIWPRNAVMIHDELAASLRGTPRQAARVRQEIRRRIAAAARTARGDASFPAPATGELQVPE